jgi:tetratricopeptide (TPR) repeat protein
MERSYFEKALTFFQLASKQDEEDEKVYLDWGLTHIFLGCQTENQDFSKIHYLEAEKKILKAGQLGHPHAYYHLACLYSLNYRIAEALSLLQKGYELDVLPKVDEIVQDEWLENVRESELFSDFLAALESKQKLKEE